MTHSKSRARDIGIPFSGIPGPLNAITDVAGVEVGHTTLIDGNGKLVVGTGPVRTGVTAVLPRGRHDARLSFAGSFALNAAGEMTGLGWVEERGFLEGPIMLTNTQSVGIVRDTTAQWMRKNGWDFEWTVPVVGETYDGAFNDMYGGHIRPDHIMAALDSARTGVVSEGNVGGGTGMMCYEYKGGIGTSSRVLPSSEGGYTVGVLVQTNYGQRRHLRLGGIKLGAKLSDDMPTFLEPDLHSEQMKIDYPHWPGAGIAGDGSIIVVIATDAPLLPHQLRRIAKRPSLGIARLGGIAAAMSGEIFVAFSTANVGVGESANEAAQPYDIKLHPNAALTSLFEAVADATEEAIVNAMVAAETVVGANGLRISALPHAKIREVFSAQHVLYS